MKFFRSLMFVVVSLFFVGAAFGQTVGAGKRSDVSFPFSAWAQLGNVLPAEKGTAVLSSYAEQGIVLVRVGGFSITPYGAISIGSDTLRKLPWENRVQVEGGIKLVRSFSHGLVWFGAGYGAETRYRNGVTSSAPLTQAGYWLGWSSVAEKKRFPGSSWGVLGTLSAVERNNFSATVHVEQGIRAGSVRGVHIVPFAEAIASKDAQKFDWNNRVMGGGGIKFVRPLNHAVIEAGAEYLREQRFQSGQTAGGYSAFVRFWVGKGRR